MKKKPSKLNFSKTVSDEYAAERKREESARSMQQEALKLRAAVLDAFGIWNDVWDSVESCHAGREVYIGEQLCDPIALLAKQLDQMLAAIVGLYGEDKVRLAFNQFSVDGYQDFDLDAARTVKILLEVFVALLDGAKSKAVSQELYQLSPLPHLCGAKALVSVVQSADRLPIVCQCGKSIGFPFDMEKCQECQRGSPSNQTDDDASEKGVAAFDIAIALGEDRDSAKAWVRRFTSDLPNRGSLLKPIGKCPNDGRKMLYRLDEILDEVGNFQTLSPRRKAALLKGMKSLLRSPRRDD